MISTMLQLEGLLGRSDGRDKLGRLVQYACRMVAGRLKQMEPSDAQAETIRILTKVMGSLGDSRRTNRWLKGVSPVLALREGLAARNEALWSRWCLAVGSKGAHDCLLVVCA